MPYHEAVFRFATPHAERILRSIEPELLDEVNPRSRISCTIRDGVLVLSVEADDTASLRAALNMYLRLISVADEMQEAGRQSRPDGPGGNGE